MTNKKSNDKEFKKELSDDTHVEYPRETLQSNEEKENLSNNNSIDDNQKSLREKKQLESINKAKKYRNEERDDVSFDEELEADKIAREKDANKDDSLVEGPRKPKTVEGESAAERSSQSDSEEKINEERNSKYGSTVILATSLISFIIAYLYNSNLDELFDGLINIMNHHHRIDSELFTVAGNFGSVWLNASIIIFFVWLTYKIFKSNIRGMELAAFGQVFGYSFYAQSIYNIWPLFIGFMIQAWIGKKNISESVALAWFSTALAPFVSTLSFHVDSLTPGSSTAILIAILFGLVLGYLVSIFAGYIRTLHEGRLLFNMGITTGVVGWIGNNILKGMSIAQEPVSDQIYIEGMNREFWLVFMVINVLFFTIGLVYNRGFKKYFKELFWFRSFGGDYTIQFGTGSALMNMGVIGTLALTYTLITPYGQLNGPILGGVFTVAGFAANGFTIRALLPIWFGIYTGSLLFGGLSGLVTGNGILASAFERVSSRAMCVAAMHGCGSAPVTEKDGWKSSSTISVLHTINTGNTAWLTGWMQSYNNGFSLGLIIILFKPIWYFFSKERLSEKVASSDV